ncbi:MAG: cysteine desulfurase family protein [Bacilli bacterium]
MIYLDYSATTPVDKRVLESFNKVCEEYIGNANSIHELGDKSKELMDKATIQVANLLGVKKHEIIFTSGATESNNLAIKGIVEKYNNRGKHIITTNIEHSSISEVMKFFEKKGYEISYVDVDSDGIVKIDHLKKLLRKDTILVSICYVNSEVGIRQPIEEIGKILKEYPLTLFHVDATQAIGKISINVDNIDLMSFSAHKFFGLKGVGVLMRKENIDLEPLFHGGESQSAYRSGTPSLPLYVSLAKSLRLILEDIDNNYNYVLELNKKLKKEFSKYKDIVINSSDKCIPHILNISLLNIKPETFVNAMSKHNIYISTKTACSSKNELSKTLLAMNKDRNIVLSSIRISLSYKTTIEEINAFLKFFDLEFKVLNNIIGEK